MQLESICFFPVIPSFTAEFSMLRKRMHKTTIQCYLVSLDQPLFVCLFYEINEDLLIDFLLEKQVICSNQRWVRNTSHLSNRSIIPVGYLLHQQPEKECLFIMTVSSKRNCSEYVFLHT